MPPEAVLGVMFLVAFLALIVLMLASMWVVFAKAGQPGWAAFVPFYNVYVMTCKIAGKDVGMFILEFVPFVNVFTSLLVMLAVARKFGRSELFGVVMWLVPFIMFPILAFGGAKYQDGREWVDDDDWDRPAPDDAAPWSRSPGRRRRNTDDW